MASKKEAKPQKHTHNRQPSEDVAPLMKAIWSRYDHQSQEKEDVRTVIKSIATEANVKDICLVQTNSEETQLQQQPREEDEAMDNSESQRIPGEERRELPTVGAFGVPGINRETRSSSWNEESLFQSTTGLENDIHGPPVVVAHIADPS